MFQNSLNLGGGNRGPVQDPLGLGGASRGSVQDPLGLGGVGRGSVQDPLGLGGVGRGSIQDPLSLGGCSRASIQTSGDGLSRSSAVVSSNALMCPSSQQVPSNSALFSLQQAQRQVQQSPNLRQLASSLSNGSLHSPSPVPQGMCPPMSLYLPLLCLASVSTLIQTVFGCIITPCLLCPDAACYTCL